MHNLIKAILLLVIVLTVALYRKTIKNFILKFKPVAVKIITAFQTGL